MFVPGAKTVLMSVEHNSSTETSEDMHANNDHIDIEGIFDVRYTRAMFDPEFKAFEPITSTWSQWKLPKRWFLGFRSRALEEVY